MSQKLLFTPKLLHVTINFFSDGPQYYPGSFDRGFACDVFSFSHCQKNLFVGSYSPASCKIQGQKSYATFSRLYNGIALFPEIVFGVFIFRAFKMAPTYIK